MENTLTYIKGNLLDAQEKVIAHQVNCRGVMGGGIAKSIKKKYPIVYEKYLERYKEEKGREEMLAGTIDIIYANENRTVINLYGQDSYGRNGRYTNYAYLSSAFLKMFERLRLNGIEAVAVPYKIGCGLGGGDWTIIESLLLDFGRTYNVKVKVYYLEEYLRG